MNPNQPNIDVFPLRQKTNGSGTIGPTGPTGAQGIGIRGPTGASGSFELTSENLTYDGTPLVVSTTLNTTYITNTSYADAVLTLADGVEGFVKYIYLNDSVLPVQIRTTRGSFNLSPINSQIQLIYTDRWIQISDKTSWYTDTQQGSKLVGTGGIGTQLQGASVALSADGNTLAIGGNDDDSDIGATWIFIRSGSTWTQQGNKLVGIGGVGTQNQGVSIALSADGNTLAVGGRDDNSNIGATWIFTRSGSTWTQQGSKLVGTGGVGTQNQGSSVALSADGNTLAVGGILDNSNIGATWIFTRSGSTWTQQGNKLVGTGGVGTQNQGNSVALSADGDTLAIGGLGDNTNIGATWIFTRLSTTWTQQGSKLVGTGGVGTQNQGNSITLSANGNILAVGGFRDNTNIGATWIFTRLGTTWTQQGSKLVGTGGIGTQNQGFSVSFSADGNTLAVGGRDDDGDVGTTWIFIKTDSSYVQQGNKLVGTGGVGTQNQGSSVSFSAIGNTLAVGGVLDNSNVGATWIFV